MTDKNKTLTTAAGIPVNDNQNSITAGERGPLLVQDWQLFEKHAHFNRERIPERVVHAKGSAAFGTLTINKSLAQYSAAKLFAAPGNKADCLLRFSTVAGERGAADAERDVRGFALKIYTEEGNWDMVGNNTPVFFVRDPYKFPDFIHTQKRDPKTNLRDMSAAWDFWSLSPESLHQITILFSDRGLPKSYRHINGYGSHTYSFYNGKGERFWVKFHFKTMQGHEHYTDEQSAQVVGGDRESHQRDLFAAIERGDFPKWRFCVQIMPESDAAEVFAQFAPGNSCDNCKSDISAGTTKTPRPIALTSGGIAEVPRIAKAKFVSVTIPTTLPAPSTSARRSFSIWRKTVSAAGKKGGGRIIARSFAAVKGASFIARNASAVSAIPATRSMPPTYNGILECAKVATARLISSSPLSKSMPRISRRGVIIFSSGISPNAIRLSSIR